RALHRARHGGRVRVRGQDHGAAPRPRAGRRTARRDPGESGGAEGLSRRDGGCELTALSVEGLNAFYGKSQVVFDLALEVEHGKIVALLGRNGAGKTSTLISIAGSPRISASSERLQLDGLEVSHLPAFKRVRAGISFVPSGSRAFPNLTVHENLAMVRGCANSARGRWTIQRGSGA